MPNNRCEMIANQLIVNRFTPDSAEFALRYDLAWGKIYPNTNVIPKEKFISQIWASTRTVLQLGDIRRTPIHPRIVFVTNRLAIYHAMRLCRDAVGTTDDLRKSMVQDMGNMGFTKLTLNLNAFIENEISFFTQQRNPGLIIPSKVSFTLREQLMLEEMYAWLTQRLVTSAEPPYEISSSSESIRIDTSLVDKYEVPRSDRRRSRHHRESPEDLEKKTLRRIEGQLSIDMMMMTRGEMSHEEGLDEDDSGQEQFLDACENSIIYKDYSSERCVNLWNSAMKEDRNLFERGKLITSADMCVICTRCLMLAMARTPEDQSVVGENIVATAYSLVEEFQLAHRPEELKKLLMRWMGMYMVEKHIPATVLTSLRENKGILEDAYAMYVEQSQTEYAQRQQEIDRRVEQLHINDRQQYRKEQHSKALQLIRDLTTLENGAPLGWLCMMNYGMTCEEERVCYYLDGMIQKLKKLSLEPFATDKVAKVFYGGEPGTEDMLDLSEQPLQADTRYRLVQLGWRYEGEKVVYPKAERIADEQGR